MGLYHAQYSGNFYFPSNCIYIKRLYNSYTFHTIQRLVALMERDPILCKTGN